MLQYLHMRRWIWGIIILFFVLFSLAPTFYEIDRQNDLHGNRYFELVHNFYTDYNFYLSRIRQGREGAWLAFEKYTSEPHQASFLQILYVLMGKVSAWIGVPWHRSADTYHTARVVFAFTLLSMIAYGAKATYKKFGWAMLAFLLSVTASSVPIPVYPNGIFRFGNYMAWWSVGESLQRITFIPHLLLGQTLILFLLLALSSKETMERKGNWVFLGFLAIILGIIFPPGLLFTAVVYGVYVLVNRFRTHIVGPLVVFLMGAPTLVALSMLVKIYPWKRLVDFDILHPHPFQLPEYLLSVGPVVVLGILGALVVLWKREQRLYIFVAWVIAWFGMLLGFQYVMGTSPLRFTEMIPHVPLAFLGIYVFYALKRPIFLAVPVLLIILGVGQMHSSYLWQRDFVAHKIRATVPLVPTGSTVMYPLKDFIGAIIFIQDYTKRSDIVLSETTAGNYIPVYSGNTVYVGHANTVAAEQKEPQVKDFFSGHMGAVKGKEFLTKHNLRYIFYGPQEKEDGGLPDLTKAYPFLTQIYENPSVRIYTW